MIIKRLKLKGYRRLFLNNIREIDYTPHEVIQLIIGPNGSGKSSLLRELSPLPANLKQDYLEDGYKLIQIEHNGQNFTLLSENDKHSFLIDGVEKNQSGTKTNQESLVKEYFKLTKSLHRLLLGTLKFTEMGPEERKRWITELNEHDHDYAMELYKKIKSKHRDLQGSIRTLEKELEKLLVMRETQEEYAKTKANIETLNQAISELELALHDMNASKHDRRTFTFDTISFTPYLGSLKEIVSSITTRKETLDVELQRQLLLLEQNEKIKTNLNEEIAKLEQIFTYSEMSKQAKAIKRELDELKSRVREKKWTSDSKLTLEELSQKFTEINSILEAISRLEYKTGSLDDFTKQREELLGKRRVYETKLELLNNSITCPSCQHVFNPQATQIDMKQESRENLLNLISVVTTASKELDYIIASLKQYQALKERLRLQFYNSLTLAPLFLELFGSDQLIKLSLDENKHNLKQLLDQISVYSVIENKQKELTELELKLQSDLEQNKQDSLNRLHELRQRDQVCEKEVLDIKTRIENLRRELQNHQTLLEGKDRVTLTLRGVEKNKQNEIFFLQKEYLLRILKVVQEELETESVKFGQYITRANRIQELETMIKSQQELMDRYGKLLETLSPKDGLIASALGTFLSNFTEQLNSVISKVWEYPLEIIPPHLENDQGIDYKFRVVINQTETLSDINELSSSMKEIVDLAFRLVAMKYAHLTPCPVYLDEFGATFDPTHRENAYRVIDTIIRDEFPQIFVISHYDSVYGLLSNAEYSYLENSVNRDNISAMRIITY